MTNTQASPALGEARGLKNENLVVMSRPTILQILARFLDEVKEAKDISPFLDRIMEDLDRPGQDGGAIAFERGAPAGERFADMERKQEELSKFGKLWVDTRDREET